IRDRNVTGVQTCALPILRGTDYSDDLQCIWHILASPVLYLATARTGRGSVGGRRGILAHLPQCGPAVVPAGAGSSGCVLLPRELELLRLAPVHHLQSRS